MSHDPGLLSIDAVLRHQLLLLQLPCPSLLHALGTGLCRSCAHSCHSLQRRLLTGNSAHSAKCLLLLAGTVLEASKSLLGLEQQVLESRVVLALLSICLGGLLVS